MSPPKSNARKSSAGKSSGGLDALLDEQLRYYRARANEYDDWFFRRGGYDRGPEANQRWFDQVETVRARLDGELARLPEDAAILELACGTGIWTERLAASGRAVHALDAAPEVLELNGARLAAAGRRDAVAYQQADLFAWRPQRRYALVFFGFWISHVPASHFERFWQRVGDSLADHGRFFFVDNLRGRRGAASDQNGERARRTLADGRAFEIVKVFHEPAALERRLSAMGYEASVEATPDHFIHGAGSRRDDA
jgi:demethylmenaquinone methyltransferase/2-methoxy-6-polyprenyl-1,4-benzoquinol methylase